MQAPPFPTPFRAICELSHRGLDGVYAGTWHGEPAVLRTSLHRQEVLGELSVLASLPPGPVAELLAYGQGAGGQYFLVRRWVFGESWDRVLLGDEFGDPSASEPWALFVELCLAVQFLHDQGFVHGDLKPQNVLVGTDGRVLLSDFGLSARRGGVGSTTGPGSGEWAVGGTAGYMAPECLSGNPTTALSDLFSLGVMACELLGIELPNASELYGRFPAEPFLESCGLSAAQLPEWSRSLLASTLSRDPSRRPQSATELGKRVAAQFAIDFSWPAARSPRWRCWAGMGSQVDAWVRRSSESTVPQLPAVWRLPWSVDPVPFAWEAARRTWSTSNRASCIELALELAGDTRTGAIDRIVGHCLDRLRGEVVFIGFNAGEPRQSKIVETLLRAIEVAPNGEALGGRLLLLASQGVSVEGAAVVTDLSLDPESWSREVGRTWPALKPAQRDAAAAQWLARTEGNPERMNQLMRELWEGGWSRPTSEGPGLRLDGWPELSTIQGAGPKLWGRVPAEWCTLARALHGSAEELSVDRLGALVERDVRAVRTGLALLQDLGLVTSHHRSEGPRWAKTGPAPAWEQGERDAYRALLVRMEDVGVEPLAAVLWRAWNPEDAEQRALLRCVELRTQGLWDASEAFLLALRVTLRDWEFTWPDSLHHELLLAQWQVGNREDAESYLEGRESQSESAVLSELRGWVASQRGQTEKSAKWFSACGRDDLATLERAHGMYREERLDELRDLEEKWSSGELGAGEAQVRAELVSLFALRRLGQGDASGAQKALESEIQSAGPKNVPHLAGLWLNAGHVQRRTGKPAKALTCYLESADAAREAGLFGALAAALGQMAIIHRELGRHREADTALSEALEIRWRSGDRAGAQLLRGILAFVRLDQGRLQEGMELAQQAREFLLQVGRESDALRMEWALALAATRLGRISARPPELADCDDFRSGADQLRCHWLWEGEAAAGGWVKGQVRQHGPDWLLGLGSFGDWFCARFGLATRAQSVGKARSGEDWLGRVTDALQSPDPVTPEMLEWLSTLEDLGHWDKLARLAVACWARGPESSRGKYWALAQTALSTVSQGLTADEAQALRSCLLGLPDPYPKDFLAWQQALDQDMQVAQILSINERLVEQEDLGTLLGAIVEAALQVTGASRGFLALEENGELAIDQAMDSSRGGIEKGDVLWSKTILHQCIQAGGALRLADAGEDSEFGSIQSVSSLELRSILCHAFQVSDDLRGAIWVDEPGRAGAFDSRSEWLLGLLAGQVALAIRQVRRFEQIKTMASQLEVTVATQHSELVGARRALAEKGIPVVVGGLIGESDAMREIHRTIRKIAPSELSVLVTGQSGTGKELVARALHDYSARSEGAFVSENCAALPESLVEAELFGYDKGSFTGAVQDRPGLFERATGGTLFLDEVGELPLETQAKLLRVLETRKVRRIGESHERSVDFRLVVATNRNLADSVEEGGFRADLLFRLDGMRLVLPSLAERVGDIPLLVDHFLKLEEVKGGPQRQVASEVMRRLVQRVWPGNVRELANEIRRLCVLSEGDIVDPKLVRENRLVSQAEKVPLIGTLDELEKAAILSAVQRNGGDKRKAAEELGISRAKIYQKLKEWRDSEGDE